MSAQAVEVLGGRTELAPVRAALRRLRGRVRALLLLRVCVLALAGTGSAAAIVLLVSKLLGLYYPSVALAQVAALVVVLSGVLAVAWPLPDDVIAAATDGRLQLRDRLGTALALGTLAAPTPMERAMLQDALDVAGRLRGSDAYPLRAPKGWRWALGALVAVTAIQLLPLPAMLLSRELREEKALLRKQGEKLLPAAQKLNKQAKESRDAEADKAAKKLKRLADELRLGKLDKKHALVRLAELDKELAIVQQRQPKLGTAERAIQKLTEQGRQQAISKADKLARQAEAKGDHKRAEQLRELAKQMSKAQSASEREKLSAQIDDLAAQMGQGVEVPQRLADALADALAGKSTEDLRKQLEQLQQAMEQGGEKLSQEELDQLAQQLQELADTLSDTELQELAKRMTEAGECMKSGDCKGAADKLCAAGKCAGGQGKLAAVCRAAGEARDGVGSACGNMKGQGQGQGPEGGDAVGADNGSQRFIPPDAPAAKLYAPRTTETSGTLQRVPAQMNGTGGPMAGTTTTGAPDVGTRSSVPYYEVMPQYSRAAEEALTKEEVPPAYRKTIREYFDALQSGAPNEAKTEER